LPVVIDIETAGFDAKKDALLELSAVFLTMDNKNKLAVKQTLCYHIEPFAKANLDEKALAFTGIDPYHPFRFAQSEKVVLTDLFREVKAELKTTDCQRAVVVAHNAAFDMSFLQAATIRQNLKTPFHHFTTFDTATLAAACYGQTVLAKAMQAAQIEFDQAQAHSALYDAEKTAELFCQMINRISIAAE